MKFGRYTKALEVLKKLHKDQAQGIKMYKLKLENLKTVKDAAHRVSVSWAVSRKRLDVVFVFTSLADVHIFLKNLLAIRHQHHGLHVAKDRLSLTYVAGLELNFCDFVMFTLFL